MLVLQMPFREPCEAPCWMENPSRMRRERQVVLVGHGTFILTGTALPRPIFMLKWDITLTTSMKPFAIGIVVVVSVTIVPWSGTAALATHSDPMGEAIGIDECTTITESGTYVLDSNLTAADRDFCLIIEGADGLILEARGHTIHGDLNAAVYVTDSRNVTVRGVSYTAHRRFGLWVEDSDGIRLENNSITLDHSRDISLARRAIIISRSEGIRLQNNTVRGIGLRNESGHDSGVQLQRSRDISISHNEIVGTSSAISTVESSEVRVERNVLRRNVYGVQIRRFSHEVLVRGNEIRNHGLCPVDVKNSSDVLIDDNRMLNHAGLGLEINATNVTISNNILRDSKSFGIIVATDSSQVIIRNNTVTNSSSYAGVGVFGRVTDVSITGNTIANNSPHGIVVEQNSFRITIHDNTIIDNAGNGIVVRPRVGEILISGNHLANNGANAIANEVPEGVRTEGNSVAPDAREPTVSVRGDATSGSTSSEVTESPGQPGFGLLSAVGAFLLFSIGVSRSRRNG